MTATMLLTAAPAAARYAHGRVAAGLLFAMSYPAVWGFAGLAVWGFAGVAVSVLYGRTAPPPAVRQRSARESTS
jgi:hypothetical protein